MQAENLPGLFLANLNAPLKALFLTLLKALPSAYLNSLLQPLLKAFLSIILFDSIVIMQSLLAGLVFQPFALVGTEFLQCLISFTQILVCL